jgi:hypothetical protein
MITSPATGEPVHFDPNASRLWAALSTLRRGEFHLFDQRQVACVSLRAIDLFASGIALAIFPTVHT